jgi:integrase
MGRRCELVRLNLSDVKETSEGLLAYIAYSKTDQRGDGREVAIPRARRDQTVCPMLATRAWRAALAEHGVTEGRLLRNVNRWGKPGTALTGHTVNRIVKTLAARAGLPNPDDYSAHSLRSGGATIAAKNRAPKAFIAAQGGWTPGSAVLEGYVRQVDRWTDNPFNDAF